MQPINHKPKTINHKPETLIFAALALLAFAIYYRGLAPSVATIFDDSLEFPLVVHRLAIAHPTGYPLYILLGRLFALFNPANIAYQLNLMSAVFGALAAGAVYLLGLRLAAPEADWTAHAGAALGALVFGTGPLFYSQATIAEVYTLNALFVAGTLLLALQQRWAGLAFLFGLSLTHHRTMLLLVPALALFVAVAYRLPRREGWRQVRGDVPILKTIIRFAAPLLLYLYLPLRGHAGSLDGTYQNSLSGFWRHVAGGGYSTFLQNNSLGNEPSLNFYVSLLKNEAGWWGLGLAVVGLAWLAGGRRWKGLALTGPACAIYFGFNVAYAVSDIEVFFIPVFLLLALWAGLGLGAILRGL
ncbi:MAG: DUF2723 domain-containing protein, partial [Anaerolineae bacterium]